ncbi:MAG: SGNH hydrolase domain-containing protein, partial [Burkholderiales bacterium]
WVGGISYSLYLWHWPLLALATAVDGDTPTSTYRVTAVVGAFLLAWISRRWVETPTRHGRPGVAPVVGMVVALAAVGVAGFAISQSDGFPQRAAQHDARRAFLKQYRDLHEKGLVQAYRAECDFYDWRTKARKPTLPASCTEAGERATYLLWGDSHAQALSWGLRETLPPGVRLAQVATSACKPSLGPGMEPGLADSCEASNRYALATLRRLRPAVVILAQSDHHEQTDWPAFAATLHAAGARRVIVVGPVPQWKPSLPLVVTRYHWDPPQARIATGLDPRVVKADRLLKARLQGAATLTYVSLLDALCTTEGCLAYVPNDPDHTLWAVDYGHLSPPASVYLAREVLAPVLTQR